MPLSNTCTFWSMHLASTFDVQHVTMTSYLIASLGGSSSLLTSLIRLDDVLKFSNQLLRPASACHRSHMHLEKARNLQSPLLPRVGETTSDERILLSEFGPCGGAISSRLAQAFDEICEGDW